MRNIWGLMLSLGYIGLTVGSATLLQNKGKLGPEGSRKFIHVGLGNWWLIAIAFFDNVWWAAALPAAFVIVNYLSYRFQLVKAMERGAGREDLGTVWYAVTLLIMAVWTFLMPEFKWAGTIAILSMGYGDGLAAVAGKRFGRKVFPLKDMRKTLEGSLVLLASVFIVSAAVLLLYHKENAWELALVFAAAAVILELATPWGLDNLTLPIGLGLLAMWSTTSTFQLDLLLGASLSVLIALPAWAARALTLPGALAATVMGALIFWSGGWAFFCALGAFYISATFVDRLGKRKKAEVAERVHQRHGTRTAVQVLVNGGMAAACAVLYKLTGFQPFAVACFASFAAASADTWASELGMLSSRQPHSILTGKPVQRGLSGGVTWLGLLGSAVGAGAVTFIALFFPSDSLLSAFLAAGVVFAAGIFGSIVDSILGDSIQAKFQHPSLDELTEKPIIHGVAATLKRGWRFVNNDMVNLLSCVCAALAGCFASIWVG